MDLIFISGWSGFGCLFPNLSKKYVFLTPFHNHMEPLGIADFLKAHKAEILIGWSTGAHIVIKNLKEIKSNFEYIILISPFLAFTDFTSEKVLGIMMENLERQPELVVQSFLKKAGAPLCKEVFDKSQLLNGLRFLLTSKAEITTVPKNLCVIHGTKDRIVPLRESLKITTNVIPVEGGNHYLNETTIFKICYEISGKKVI